MNGLTVGFDRDRAVEIRSVDGGAYRLVAIDHVTRRMPEGVAATGADDGDVWA